MVLNDVTFIRLLEYLQRRFQVVSLETLLSDEKGEVSQGKPWCLLTFDDGWRDTYTTAYPWLKKFGMPATVFLATGSVERRGGFWVEQLRKAWRVPSSRAQMRSVLSQFTELEDIVEWLKHMPTERRNSVLERLLPVSENGDAPDDVDSMLTWKQAIEMSRDGVEMGAHTVNHPLLSYENDLTIERELRLSKQTLEEKLGKNARAFAYPNGDWDEHVRQWVEQVGYECAFTTHPGWYDQRLDPYTIRRIVLHEGNVTGRDGQFSPAVLSLTLACWA
ncbi:MAG: polysaccharide deacetylase family protein [Candidatus Acidiferrales bacterium]